MARPWLLDHDLVGRRARCFRSSESGWLAVDGTIRGWRPIVESVGNAGLAEWRVVLDPDREFAHHLYAVLRELDARGCTLIVATIPAARDLGVAIGDRLRRAAAGRSGSDDPDA